MRAVVRAGGTAAALFGLLLVYLPCQVRRLDPVLTSSLGAVVTGGGALLFLGGALLWGAGLYYLLRRGDATAASPDASNPPRMVVGGPYAHVQHPTLLGLASMAFGEALWLRSPSLGVYAVLLAVLLHVYVLRVEEPALERSFGDDYRAYRAAVPRWLPFLAPPARKGPGDSL